MTHSYTPAEAAELFIDKKDKLMAYEMNTEDQELKEVLKKAVPTDPEGNEDETVADAADALLAAKQTARKNEQSKEQPKL